MQSADYTTKQVPHKLGAGMLVLPSKKIYRCWCSLYLPRTYMYNLFLAEIFCNTAVTHSAIFSTIGSPSGSISQPNLVLHMDFIPQGSQSRCGPRMGYRGIFLKIPPASLELVAFLWGSGSLDH